MRIIMIIKYRMITSVNTKIAMLSWTDVQVENMIQHCSLLILTYIVL